MDSYEVFRTIVYKYVVIHAKIVGHHPFVSKPTYATYMALFIWYSYLVVAVYTIFTSDRGIAILNVFFFLLVSQVITYYFDHLRASQVNLKYIHICVFRD